MGKHYRSFLAKIERTIARPSLFCIHCFVNLDGGKITKGERSFENTGTVVEVRRAALQPRKSWTGIVKFQTHGVMICPSLVLTSSTYAVRIRGHRRLEV